MKLLDLDDHELDCAYLYLVIISLALDSVSDDLEASLPRFLVPAAAELSRHDMSEGLDKRIND